MHCSTGMYRRTASVKQRGSTFTGVVLGLLIGVAIAVGVALYINFGSKPFTGKAPSLPPTDRATPSDPVALPGKPGDAPLDKPKFDFYKILPGESAPSPDVAAPTTEPTQPQRIYVQAGAFQNPSDADNLKARLALMGMEAGVQKVDIADKGTWHRVRVGPFSTPQAADSARARLAQEGIESSVVRSPARSAANAGTVPATQ